MASGKVWIRCPITRPQDQQAEEQREQGVVRQQAAPIAVGPWIATVATEHIVGTPMPAETVQPEIVVAGPQPVIVETIWVEITRPEVIAALVEEQPQIIVTSDVPIAEEITVKAKPAADVVTASVAERPAEVAIPQSEVVEEVAEVMETMPVIEEAVAPRDIATAPVIETEVVKTEVIIASAGVEHLHSHATAPMTRAPVSEYMPGAPCHSD